MGLERIKKGYNSFIRDLKKYVGKKLGDKEKKIVNKECELILSLLDREGVAPKAIKYFDNLRRRILAKGKIDSGIYATLKNFEYEIH